MVSHKRIVAYLDDDDWELFQLAVAKYDIEQSKLIKEIIHSWLFANKLQLGGKKNG